MLRSLQADGGKQGGTGGKGLQGDAGPGIMTPPSILASASKTLMVVAVPMSKIMQGQSNSSMAATAPATRSAPRVDGSFSLIFSPVFMPGPMHKGSVRVRRLTAVLFRRSGRVPPS